jgi:hypothetical protein
MKMNTTMIAVAARQSPMRRSSRLVKSRSVIAPSFGSGAKRAAGTTVDFVQMIPPEGVAKITQRKNKCIAETACWLCESE